MTMRSKQIHVYIKDGILFCCIDSQSKLDLETAIKIVEERLKISEGKSFPTYFDCGQTKYAIKEVREYLTTEGTKCVKAAAFYTCNIETKIFINTFLNIYLPGKKTKIFSNKEHAIEWLKKFV